MRVLDLLACKFKAEAGSFSFFLSFLHSLVHMQDLCVYISVNLNILSYSDCDSLTLVQIRKVLLERTRG